MIKTILAAMFLLSAFSAPLWAANIPYDCAEGSDEDVVAETKPTPKPTPPAGV
jgi:hypothetical protein